MQMYVLDPIQVRRYRQPEDHVTLHHFVQKQPALNPMANSN